VCTHVSECHSLYGSTLFGRQSASVRVVNARVAVVALVMGDTLTISETFYLV